MAKADGAFAGDWEPVCRRDPVSGRETCYLRIRHNRVHAARLQAFDACLRDALTGRQYHAGSRAADAAAVRAAFAEAVRACQARVH